MEAAVTAVKMRGMKAGVEIVDEVGERSMAGLPTEKDAVAVVTTDVEDEREVRVLFDQEGKRLGAQVKVTVTAHIHEAELVTITVTASVSTAPVTNVTGTDPQAASMTVAVFLSTAQKEKTEFVPKGKRGAAGHHYALKKESIIGHQRVLTASPQRRPPFGDRQVVT